MTNLAKVAASVIEFADRNNLTLVPAAPERDLGPEVNLTPEALNLPKFLDLAAKLGGGVVYLKSIPFDPDDEMEDPPANLLQHKGEIGQVLVAFSANGLIHFWEQSAPWQAEWQELANASPQNRYTPYQRTEEEPERLSDEERARQTAELVERLLADAEFRAAKPGGARQRYAKFAIPEGTDKWVGWDAVRDALERAELLAQAQYAQVTARLDDLAADLLTDAGYQKASSPGARKLAAERFLIPRADGFAPSALVRDELYAKAQNLAKTPYRSATLL